MLIQKSNSGFSDHWFWMVAVSTLIAAGCNCYFLASGHFIIVQNIFYVPIILSCFRYLKRGFVFSVALAVFYLCLVMLLTNDNTIILKAITRVAIFILIAGVVTYLSIQNSHAEGELEKYGQQMASILEYAEEGIFGLNQAGEHTFVNPTAARMLGYGIEELIGRSSHDTWHHKHTDGSLYSKEACPIYSTLQDGAIHQGEEQFICKDGRVIEVNFTSAPVYRSGIIVGAVVTFRDITENKKMEGYREMGRDVLQILNEPGTFQESIRWVLGKLKEWTGFDAIGIRLKDGEDFPYLVQNGFSSDFLLTENSLIERDVDGANCRDENGNIKLGCTCGLVISGKADLTLPFFTQGGSFWTNDSFPILEMPLAEDPRFHPRNKCIHQNYASVALVPIKAHGRIIGLLQFNDKRKGCFSENSIELLESIASHIGSALTRKHADERLLVSEGRFKKLFMEAPVGIALIDSLTGQFCEVNAKFAEIAGLTMEEMVRIDWMRITHPEDIRKDLDNMAQLNAGEISGFQMEKRYLHRDGSVIWISMTIVKVEVDESGRLCHLCIVENINERKRLERALIEAERLSAIGELSSGVAHDFNNSLQVIFGNLEMALTVPELSEELFQYIEAAKKSTGNAVSRVRQLQRFTKKESDAKHVLIDLRETLEDSISQTKPIWKDGAEKNGLKISFLRNFDDAAIINGEPGELGSVFHNLIKNAVEAMPDGGVITVETGMAKDNQVYVRISDTGTGMTDEVKNRVFQPFFSTKGYDMGRGLGMSGVYSIVRDHGGSIFIKETEVGRGTTFEMLFPAGTMKLNRGAADIAMQYPKISAQILWVDDEQAIRQLGKLMMKRLGHLIDTAKGGEEALEFLGKKHYDLLITDVGMPGMSGWQLAKNIKGKYMDLKVAIVSGWGDVTSEKKRTECGVGYVLGKPTGIKELQNLIGEALQSMN